MAHNDETKQLFLDALAKTGVVGSSMGAAGIKSYTTVAKWRENDPPFAEAYTEALQMAADTIEREVYRRGIEGVTRLRVIGSGESAQLVEELTYSDTLALALLKAKKPDEFADRSKAEISNPDGSLRPENPTDAAARLAAILDEARRRRDASSTLLTDDDDLFN